MVVVHPLSPRLAFNCSLENIPTESGVLKLVLPLPELDVEKARKHFSKSFALEVYFLDAEQVSLARAETEKIRTQATKEKDEPTPLRAMNGLRTRAKTFHELVRQDSKLNINTSRFFTLDVPQQVANSCPVCSKVLKPEDVTMEVRLSIMIPLY